MKIEVELHSGGKLVIEHDPKHLSIEINDTSLEFATVYPRIQEKCDFAVSLTRTDSVTGGRKHKWLDTKID